LRGRRDRRKRRGHRPFPVGPGDEDRGNVRFRPVQPLQNRVDRGETKFHPPGRQGFQAGERREGVCGQAAFQSSSRQRTSVSFISERSTTKSSIPCSSRNSDLWNPSGSVWRIVCSITRGPAKPINAFGSPTFRSPSIAYEAVTPPVVGSATH